MRIHTGITPLLRGSITQRVGAVLNPPARRQLQVFLPAADFVVVFVAVVVFRAIFMVVFCIPSMSFLVCLSVHMCLDLI